MYGPEVITDALGNPVTSASVTVYEDDGATLATIYTGPQTGTVLSAAGATTTDAFGNLTFFAPPGLYTLSFTVSGTVTTKTVEVSPYYADLTTFLPNSGGPLAGTRLTPSTTVPGPVYSMQTFTTTYTASSAGNTISFPTAWANSLEGVVACIADNSSGANVVPQFSTGLAKGSFVVKTYIAGTVQNSGTFRIFVMAWGS
jgi:hypothetical protein